MLDYCIVQLLYIKCASGIREDIILLLHTQIYLCLYPNHQMLLHGIRPPFHIQRYIDLYLQEFIIEQERQTLSALRDPTVIVSV